MECGEIGEVDRSREENAEGYPVGMLADESEKRPVDVFSGAALRSAGCLETADCDAFLEAFFLFLEASGSLIKIHSRPREEHLEHGYWRLHFTFDSAQA